MRIGEDYAGYGKRPTNVSINQGLLEAAKALDINLSATLTAALLREIQESEATRWKRENSQAMQELNRITDDHGLLSDDYRTF